MLAREWLACVEEASAERVACTGAGIEAVVLKSRWARPTVADRIVTPAAVVALAVAPGTDVSIDATCWLLGIAEALRIAAVLTTADKPAIAAQTATRLRNNLVMVSE